MKTTPTSFGAFALVGVLFGCRGEMPREQEDGPFAQDTYHLEGVSSELPRTFESHLPACSETLALSDLPIRLFADDGHTFYFELSPEAARAGDEKGCDSEPPAQGTACPNFADNVRILPFGMSVCSDTGKVQLDLRGGKNFRPWLKIPTLHFDTGQFSSQKFGQGDSHLRFQNGQNGRTILREAVALRIWRALGFPVPSSSFVKTGSNIWDTAGPPGTWAAHLIIQRYKKAYFDEHMPDALHVWEGDGDPLGSDEIEDGFSEADCEWSAEDDCDRNALQAVVSDVRAQDGSGFFEGTQELIDWPNVHAFQCLSALTDTGKDWIHDDNNVVLVLTTEGALRYLPYNMDASGGFLAQEGEPTPYVGSAYLVDRCQEDAECRAHGVAVCESLLDAFDALDVESSIVDERCETLDALGLVRHGDEEACEQMKEYYRAAANRVRTELSGLDE